MLQLFIHSFLRSFVQHWIFSIQHSTFNFRWYWRCTTSCNYGIWYEPILFHSIHPKSIPCFGEHFNYSHLYLSIQRANFWLDFYWTPFSEWIQFFNYYWRYDSIVLHMLASAPPSIQNPNPEYQFRMWTHWINNNLCGAGIDITFELNGNLIETFSVFYWLEIIQILRQF